MQKLFNNILLPVELDRYTPEVIARAIELANRLECNLHIVCISKRDTFSASRFLSFNRKHIEAEMRFRLGALVDVYRGRLRKGLSFIMVFMKGRSGNEIAAYTANQNIDLVLTGEHSGRISLFRKHLITDQLAVETNCAILVLDNNLNGENFETIILPISRALPLQSIRTAIYLATVFHSSIHLVALREEAEMPGENLSTLKKSYRILRDNTDINVVCKTCEGKSLRTAVKDYIRTTHGGLVVTNSLQTSSNSGFFRRLFNGDLFHSRKIPHILVDRI